MPEPGGFLVFQIIKMKEFFLGKPLVWAEVNLQAIAHNIDELKRIIAPDVKLLVAVKADAYGHGLLPVAQTVLQNNADFLGVARLEEGIKLRQAGINAPIIIFGYVSRSQTSELIDFDLIPTIFSLQSAKIFSQNATAKGKKLKVHLKIDTGMGRLGFLPDSARCYPKNLNPDMSLPAEILQISRMPGIILEGIYTHFASADSYDKAFALTQFNRFKSLLNQLENSGIKIPLRHAANSGAIIDMPQTHLDMVRSGISVYGLFPSKELEQNKISLKPAMTLKTTIIHLKKVHTNFKVSYGSTWQTSGPALLATVAIGYADGYSRLLSNQGQMLVRGQRAPIVGRICMDLTILDVSHIPNVKIEDEVVVFGKQNNHFLSVDEVAKARNTINYEVVSSLTARVQRIYKT